MSYKKKTPMSAKTKRTVTSAKKKASQVRIALFTHDTFGLGHVRRSLHIMRALSHSLPNSSLLLITGSPVLPLLKDLPPNADYVKIPTVVKTGASGSQPPHLPHSVSETTLMRSQIIRETVLSFQPDVFIVDNFPLGSQAELLPILQALKPLSTKTVLGMRDILDTPDTVRTDWKRQGIYNALERYYDRILVYGSKKIFHIVDGYGLSPLTARKIRYCGYLTELSEKPLNPEDARRELGINGHFILVTGGGGGDAFPLVNTYIDALPRLPHIPSVIVTGPLMGSVDRAELQNRVNGNSHVIVRDFIPDISSYLGMADVVITMCGYNTAAEIMVQRPKAIVVPRTWKYGNHKKWKQSPPEGEQIMRARALARIGLIQMIEPEHLHPSSLSQKIREVLNGHHKRPRISVDVHGLNTAVREIIETAFPGR